MENLEKFEPKLIKPEGIEFRREAENEMEKAKERAGILAEALPYIEKFRDKTIVVKCGGSTIAGGGVEKNIVDVVLMKRGGINPVIVHGGGPHITESLKKAGKESKFVDGLRVTDEESIGIVSKTLSQVNEEIVSRVKEVGGKAIGLDNIVRAKKYPPLGQGVDIGFVGEVKYINSCLAEMVAKEEIPIINPLGRGEGDEKLNVNADEAAAKVAIELKAEKFIILTDVPGIMMRNQEGKESLISTLTIDCAKNLIENKIITGGMIPKVTAAIIALQGGVEKVHIVDGRMGHSILLEIFTDEGIGTQIVK